MEAQLLAKRATNGGFSIVELSKVVGISPSTIYDHFESNLELERALVLILNPPSLDALEARARAGAPPET